MMAPPRQYRLTPEAKAFSDLCEKADLKTEAEIADMLGVSIRTARGYRGGDPIPEPVMRLMRAIVRYEIELDMLL
jgi:hypothetical protein